MTEQYLLLNAEPVSISAMMQHDTDDQKQALCDVIDALPDDARISSDWSGETYTKETAKKYVLEYDKPEATPPLSLNSTEEGR